MQKYYLKQSPKTKFLNFFRKVFVKIRFLEKTLASITTHSSFFLWHKLIPPNYLYPQNSARTATRNTVNYKLDISNVGDHYLYFGIKNTVFDHVLPVIKSAEVIADIGANIGTTALFFANQNPQAHIYAFEPHPNSFKKASENIALNRFKNIHLINIGLGEQPATLKLYEVNKYNSGMNRILSQNMDNNLSYVEIVINTFDNFCKKNEIKTLNFVKIDVEGFEYWVIKGGVNTLQKYKPVLFVELNDNSLKEGSQKSAKEFIELLNSIGYNTIYRSDTLQNISSETNFTNCHYDIIAEIKN